ncbi:IS1595 family transposase [Crocinitomix algicola]|uniref:IS1595 family transposase n=1 Tax=Crocinitomix algicola TaxID=1740263 RepID=UPI0008730191|nr:IS1595 family transposase [Crocinitomix algicola]
MLLKEFYKKYCDERTCKLHYKRLREQNGIYCKRCSGTKHYWLKSKEQWQCKSCKFRTTLRSGTVMESSNLPFHLWYQTFYLLTTTKKSISTCEIQRKLGLKRYEPAWYMVHKIRRIMSKINEIEQYSSDQPYDELYLTRFNQPEKSGVQNNQFRRKKGHYGILMTSCLNERSKTNILDKIRLLAVDQPNEYSIKKVSIGKVYQTENYRNFKILNPLENNINFGTFPKSPRKSPWINTIIRNFKIILRGIHHHISPKLSQLYYDEYCFKYNHRHTSEPLKTVMRFGVLTYWYDCGQP